MKQQPKYIFVHDVRIWKHIVCEDEQFPDYYYISRYGQIFSAWCGEYLQFTQNARGYLVVSLQTVDGRRIQRRVHRLVKYTFDYFPGCELYQVDHLDGNKTNNVLENLDWVTPQENIRRAEISGQRHHLRLLEEGDIYQICDMIIAGYTNEEIRQEIPNATDMSIGEIMEGRRAKHLISQQCLQQMRDVRRAINKEKAHTVISSDKIHEVCQYFQSHPILNYDKMGVVEKGANISKCMKAVGLDPENEKERRLVVNLYNKRTNPGIVSMYDY
ncbi:MAG: HNH endonuclease [Acholeplasmatales bacterium]|nr:HNH endonuclease [Acholeplasmatales bacterium]